MCSGGLPSANFEWSFASRASPSRTQRHYDDGALREVDYGRQRNYPNVAEMLLATGPETCRFEDRVDARDKDKSIGELRCGLTGAE